MSTRLVGRASLAAAIALGVDSVPHTARADWAAHASGVRYWLPPAWPTSALAEGTIARNTAGVAVWVVPLGAAQLSSASTPEALFGATLTRPRALSRTVSLSTVIPNGRWSQGTATFERRSVRWWARVVRLDANRGVLAVGISSRATLASADAELLETALNSAYLVETPGVVRYVGMGTFSMAGRVARTITTPVIFELQGTGQQRTLLMPDLDDHDCSFRVTLQQSGALRLAPDQPCQLPDLGMTMVLTGGQIELAGATMSFGASGRMSFIARIPRGPAIAGSVSFNWRLDATRPQ